MGGHWEGPLFWAGGATGGGNAGSRGGKTESRGGESWQTSGRRRRRGATGNRPAAPPSTPTFLPRLASGPASKRCGSRRTSGNPAESSGDKTESRSDRGERSVTASACRWRGAGKQFPERYPPPLFCGRPRHLLRKRSALLGASRARTRAERKPKRMGRAQALFFVSILTLQASWPCGPPAPPVESFNAQTGRPLPHAQMHAAQTEFYR